MTHPVSRLYPEIAVGGYSRADQIVDLYGRINALLKPDSIVVDFGAGRIEQVIGVDVDPVVKENRSLPRPWCGSRATGTP